MLKKTHIRRPITVLLMVLGAAMIFMAPETWEGAVVIALGVAVELAGIASARKG